MKNLLIILMMLISFSAISQSLKTDVRVVQQGKEEDVMNLSYEITMVGDTLSFNCQNCESTFDLELDEFLEEEKVNGFTLVTYSTTDTDEIVFVYNPKGNLTAITIKQYNNVLLTYMKLTKDVQDEQKSTGKTYRL
jgi:hypothetical protein